MSNYSLADDLQARELEIEEKELARDCRELECECRELARDCRELERQCRLQAEQVATDKQV